MKQIRCVYFHETSYKNCPVVHITIDENDYWWYLLTTAAERMFNLLVKAIDRWTIAGLGFGTVVEDHWYWLRYTDAAPEVTR